MGNLEAAQQYAAAAIAYYEQNGDRLSLEKLRGNLAQAYIQTGEFEKSIQTATPAFVFFESAKLPYWTAVTAANLAEASFELGNLSKAIHYAEQVLAIDEPHTHPYAWYTLGLVHHQENHLKKAEAALQSCQKLAEENEDKFIEAYAWQMLGKLWQENDKPEQAEQARQRARQQFISLGMNAEAI